MPATIRDLILAYLLRGGRIRRYRSAAYRGGRRKVRIPYFAEYDYRNGGPLG